MSARTGVPSTTSGRVRWLRAGAVVAAGTALCAVLGAGVTSGADAVAGTPVVGGVDPASHRQTSLAEAGSRSVPLVRGGTAARTVPVPPAPRRESTAGLRRGVVSAPEDVLSPEAAAGGCFLEYGEGGQCLPLRPPAAAGHGGHGGHGGHSRPLTWTCALVRTTFPDGVELRQEGQDPLRLDTDGDGLGCGPGD